MATYSADSAGEANLSLGRRLDAGWVSAGCQHTGHLETPVLQQHQGAGNRQFLEARRIFRKKVMAGGDLRLTAQDVGRHRWRRTAQSETVHTFM